MDRDPHQPLTTTSSPPSLTPEEAKARLRAAAQDVTLGAIMGGKWGPWLLGAALLGGCVVGRRGLSKTAGSVFIQSIAPMLLRVLLRKKGTHSAGCAQCSTGTEDSRVK